VRDCKRIIKKNSVPAGSNLYQII